MDYWKKRYIELEALIKKRTDRTVSYTNNLYEDALTEMQKDIDTIIGTYTKNGNITKNQALKLLNTKMTKETRERLLSMYHQVEDKNVKKAILSRLNAPAYAARIERIEALKDLIYCEALMVGIHVSKKFQNRLIDSCKESYYKNTYLIQKRTGYHYDFNKLSNNNVKAAIATDWRGSNYSKRLWKNTKLLAKTLEQTITKGLMTGATLQEMAEQVADVMGSGRKNTNRLVRTEVNYVSNQGAMLAYKQAGIKKYIFIATLDLRTSTMCREHDGNVYLVSEKNVGKNYPPLHPYCRSVTGAYIDGRDRSKLKRRALNPKTGQSMLVPQDMTYNQWYEKYVK